MERKLELKNFAGYLLYGLKMLEKRTGDIFPCVGISWEEELFKGGDSEYDWWNVNQFKPVLRPLSDIYKTITHNGVEEIPIVECAKVIIPNFEWIYHYDKRIGYSAAKGVCKNEDDEYFLSYTNNQFVFARNITTLCIPNNYKLFDYLNSRFIDYRNLIDDGLAVSVYDLGNNPYK